MDVIQIALYEEKTGSSVLVIESSSGRWMISGLREGLIVMLDEKGNSNSWLIATSYTARGRRPSKSNKLN